MSLEHSHMFVAQVGSAEGNLSPNESRVLLPSCYMRDRHIPPWDEPARRLLRCGWDSPPANANLVLRLVFRIRSKHNPSSAGMAVPKTAVLVRHRTPHH